MSKYARLNPEQKSALEAVFVNKSYLDQNTLTQLSKETDLNEKRIRNWFRGRRTNLRKGRKEGTISKSEYF